MSRVIVAVDPGVSRSGVILMDDDKEVLIGATFASTGKKFTAMNHGPRVDDLAHEIWSCTCDQLYWRDGVSYSDVVLVIETPIMNKARNVKNYALQWRTVQAIIGVFRNKWDVDVIEVHNTAVKIAATGRGDASKDEIVFNSPYKYGMFGNTVTGNASVEALADAWGIALCAFDPLSKHIRYDSEHPRACTEGTIHEH